MGNSTSSTTGTPTKFVFQKVGDINLYVVKVLNGKYVLAKNDKDIVVTFTIPVTPVTNNGMVTYEIVGVKDKIRYVFRISFNPASFPIKFENPRLTSSTTGKDPVIYTLVTAGSGSLTGSLLGGPEGLPEGIKALFEEQKNLSEEERKERDRNLGIFLKEFSKPKKDAMVVPLVTVGVYTLLVWATSAWVHGC